MSWIDEYDTQGREFPTCVHVTKTTGTMTHGATYVPIEDGKAVRAENAKLRELVRDYEHCSMHADCDRCEYDGTTSTHCPLSPCFPDIDELHELGVEVDG